VRILDLETQISRIDHGLVDRYSQFEAGIMREQMSNSVNVQTVGVAQLGASQTQASELRQTSLVAARAAADEAQKHLDRLKRDREFFTVTSAIDGVVVYGSFNHQAWHPIEPDVLAPGQKAQMDQVLMTVYSPGKLRLAAQCPENQVSYFQPGTKVRVAPVALSDVAYQGVCQPPPAVTEAQGPRQVFNVIVDLPSVDPRLAPGFSADVNLDAGVCKGVLLVPATAVWRSKVWTAPPTSGAEEARRVVVGATDGQEIEIKSGLAEGDTVLTQANRPAGGQ
jgi:multidrug efflux pump subunit AcrA (membrane-fusion protein)